MASLAGLVGRHRRDARRPRRRVWMVSPEGFRELRYACLLSNRKAAARYLGVCERTIRHWDSGRNRVPWSVVRLLRLLRCGDLGALVDEWDGWTLNRLGLHAPVGRTYREPDMRRWWLTCEHARFWRDAYDRACDSERLEGASTFAPASPGQSEDSRRETASPASPGDTAVPAHPPSDARARKSRPEPAAQHQPAAPAGARQAGPAIVVERSMRSADGRRRGRVHSAPSGAGLVSSLKQVRSHGSKRTHRKASDGANDAR